MEDTQVLDAQSKAAPLQAPEAIDDNAFLNTIQPPQNTDPNPKIYNTNTPVVGEKDHANEIAMNIGSYDYQSKVDQSKEPVVTTQSTTKGNITDKKDWGSQYVMEDKIIVALGHAFCILSTDAFSAPLYVSSS